MTVDIPACVAIFSAVKSAWLAAFWCISCMTSRSCARRSCALMRCLIAVFPPLSRACALADALVHPGWYVEAPLLLPSRRAGQGSHISQPVLYGPLLHSLAADGGGYLLFA